MGREPISVYAVDHRQSRGRLYEEPEIATRTAYQRDRDRIVHSTAFRRLKHKTQVFVATEADHYRTRLTHTIEVSQIARAFARALRLDDDLTEAVALVHDFGHPPFGHAGERALHRAMEPYGGFDHNAQALRIVTELEQRYAEFDGLNLSWETLEGLVKHNGPLRGPFASEPLPPPVATFDAVFPLDLERHASLEAQCAAIADDIAYNTHDLDDGLRAGLIELDDLRDLALAGSILSEIEARYPALSKGRLANEIMRRHITRMVEDVIDTSLDSLARIDPKSPEAVRDAGSTIIAFSPQMRAAVDETSRFLFQRVYRSDSVLSVMQSAENVVEELFHRFLTEPSLLPTEWSREFHDMETSHRARRIADYLSGMTDTYALGEHRRLFDRTPPLG